jgi:ribosomal protein S12 methylthiotransferase accessory factor YcaO
LFEALCLGNFVGQKADHSGRTGRCHALYSKYTPTFSRKAWSAGNTGISVLVKDASLSQFPGVCVALMETEKTSGVASFWRASDQAALERSLTELMQGLLRRFNDFPPQRSTVFAITEPNKLLQHH